MSKITVDTEIIRKHGAKVAILLACIGERSPSNGMVIMSCREIVNRTGLKKGAIMRAVKDAVESELLEMRMVNLPNKPQVSAYTILGGGQ